MKSLLVCVSLLMSIAFAPQLYAADSDSPGSNESAESSALAIQKRIKKARSLIGNQKYKHAIRQLNYVVRADYRNADAWNLIGYSNRKLGKYKKAGKAYRKALKHNPEHKGALEYQGELFINLKEYAKARANRDQLIQLCPSGCEELDDLNQALASTNTD